MNSLEREDPFIAILFCCFPAGVELVEGKMEQLVKMSEICYKRHSILCIGDPTPPLLYSCLYANLVAI